MIADAFLSIVPSWVKMLYGIRRKNNGEEDLFKVPRN